MNQPIFIFSAGWRSGSTMLQRLITATGSVLVWGEAGGALDRLADAYACYEQMLGPGGHRFKHGFGGNGAKEYQDFVAADRKGFNEWIACMNPPAATFAQSFRDFLQAVYARQANELGYGNWGIKEVQSGQEAAHFLHTLFPDALFIFLVRHPVACLTSIKRHDWLDRPNDPKALEYYASHWVRLAGEFRQMDFGKLVKYEDLVSSPETQKQLGAYLGLHTLADCFKEVNRADWKSLNNAALSFWERRRLLRIVREEMRHHGYE
jgi:Sulfotransferase family